VSLVLRYHPQPDIDLEEERATAIIEIMGDSYPELADLNTQELLTYADYPQLLPDNGVGFMPALRKVSGQEIGKQNAELAEKKT